MVTSTVTPPPGYSVENPNSPPSASPGSAAGAEPGTPSAVKPPPGYAVEGPNAQPVDPGDGSVSGELTNDVGNKVIVPKEGEEFGDTIKRAVAYHRSLTPEQQKQAISKEMATVPEKTAETLGGAAGMGILGPALLAAPGEALFEGHALVSAGLKALGPALIRGTVAVGEWAAEHPVAAKAVYHTIKWAIQGSAAGTAAKIIGKVISDE